MSGIYIRLFIKISAIFIFKATTEPTIRLEVTTVRNITSKVLQFVCSSEFNFIGCAVEFLINNRTSYTLRYYNKTCYHMQTQCNPKICKCSEDCSNFKLNHTVTHLTEELSYGCAARFEDNNAIYGAFVDINSHDFKVSEERVYRITNKNLQQTVPTLKSNEEKASDYHVIIGLISSMLAILVIWSIIWIMKKMYCKYRNKVDKDQKRKKRENISIELLDLKEQNRSTSTDPVSSEINRRTSTAPVSLEKRMNSRSGYGFPNPALIAEERVSARTYNTDLIPNFTQGIHMRTEKVKNYPYQCYRPEKRVSSGINNTDLNPNFTQGIHMRTEKVKNYPHQCYRPENSRSKKTDSGYSDGDHRKSEYERSTNSGHFEGFCRTNISGTRQSASTESKSSEEIMTRNKTMGHYKTWENKPFLKSK